MDLDLLSCPACNGSLSKRDRDVECAQCGTVGVDRGGLVDFLHARDELGLANNGLWDLAEDRRIGLELIALFSTSTYSELKQHATSLRTDDLGFQKDPHARLIHGRLARRAQKRFDRRYQLVAKEVGRQHGHQIIHKIEARLNDLDLPPIPSGVAVEVGGGDGQYLLGF